MRRYFTDDSLEDFLKQNADRFQMRPSDKVWQGISANLKRRNRRIGWIASLLLLLTGASGYLLSQYESDAGRAGLAQQPGSKASSASGNGNSLPPVSTASARSGSSNLTASPRATVSAPTLPSSTLPSASVAAASILGAEASATRQPSALRPVIGTGNDATATATRRTTRGSRGSNPLRLAYSAYRANPANGAVAASSNPLPVEGYDPEGADHDRTNAALEQPALAPSDLAKAPLSDPGTATSIKLTKPAKMSVQFFFTPTISYRKLSENKEFTSTTPQSAAPNYAALYNINDAVTHKPNIGLEIGLTAKYPVARNLKVQGGLQFNMSRYDVHVFDNHWVNEAATMALRDGRTSVSATPYSNFNGARRDWLQNLYFQVSVPVGLEVKLAGNDKTQFGIASTVQPTYLLSDRVFMLSTDYKNYVEVPWLMRRLNVNSSLTTYVSYSTGKVNWQMGPQIRYQLLSSFASKYPVKENLFDFGLRVGVTFKKSAASGTRLRN